MSKIVPRYPTDDVPQDIVDLVDDIGIQRHLNGYDFILYSLYLLSENPNNKLSIHKDIYQKISVVFDTTPSRIERSIRHAIEVLFSRGEWMTIQKYFGNSIDMEKCKLTNSQFLYSLAKLIHRNRVDHA